MEPRENPDAAPPVEPGTSAEPREPESLATAPAVSEPVLLENPHPVTAAPSESMENAVTVEQAHMLDRGERESMTIETSDVGSVADVFEPIAPVEHVEPVLLENPNEPTPAPSEGTASVVTLEGPSSAPAVASSSSETRTPAAPAAAQVPQAVRELPHRPRVRASFYYDQQDRMTVELVLMNERRELLHRFALHAEPEGALSRIFEALVGVATHAASEAGVFGSRK